MIYHNIVVTELRKSESCDFREPANKCLLLPDGTLVTEHTKNCTQVCRGESADDLSNTFKKVGRAYTQEQRRLKSLPQLS